MSTIAAQIDMRRYGRLLAKAAPTVIRSEEENDRMLGIVESLMAKGEANLSPEEDALLAGSQPLQHRRVDHDDRLL